MSPNKVDVIQVEEVNKHQEPENSQVGRREALSYHVRSTSGRNLTSHMFVKQRND